MNNILYQPIIKIKYYVYTYKSLFPSTELISSNNVLQKRKKIFKALILFMGKQFLWKSLLLEILQVATRLGSSQAFSGNNVSRCFEIQGV